MLLAFGGLYILVALVVLLLPIRYGLWGPSSLASLQGPYQGCLSRRSGRHTYHYVWLQDRQVRFAVPWEIASWFPQARFASAARQGDLLTLTVPKSALASLGGGGDVPLFGVALGPSVYLEPDQARQEYLFQHKLGAVIFAGVGLILLAARAAIRVRS